MKPKAYLELILSMTDDLESSPCSLESAAKTINPQTGRSYYSEIRDAMSNLNREVTRTGVRQLDQATSHTALAVSSESVYDYRTGLSSKELADLEKFEALLQQFEQVVEEKIDMPVVRLAKQIAAMKKLLPKAAVLGALVKSVQHDPGFHLEVWRRPGRDTRDNSHG